MHPMKINVSAIPRPGGREHDLSGGLRLASLGFTMTDIYNVPIKIKSLGLQNAFMKP